MTRTASRLALVLGWLALSALVAPTAAYAQSVEPQPDAAPDLAVVLDGPATGIAGSTATWALSVRNIGTAAASGFNVVTDLPAGISALSAGTAENWTCALGQSFTRDGEGPGQGILSCTFEQDLPAGAQTSTLPVELAYDDELRGPQQVGASVGQPAGEPDDSLADNRASRTTTLSAPAAAGASGPATSTPVAATPPVSAAAPVPAAPPAAAMTSTQTGTPATLPFTGEGTALRALLGASTALLGVLLVLAGRPRRTA